MKTQTPLPPAASRAYALWLDAVYTEIENATGATRSDAQGIADVQPFALAQAWGAGKDALDAAEMVLKAGSEPAAGQAAHTPTPWQVESCPHAEFICFADEGQVYQIASVVGLKRVQDAAFIVRACNEYDANQNELATHRADYSGKVLQLADLERKNAALVAALENLTAASDSVAADLRGWGGCVGRSHGCNSLQAAAADTRRAKLRSIAEAARAALAAAKGVQSSNPSL